MRYQFQGRRREIGLGSTALVTLQEARQKSLHHRKTLADGKDPYYVRKLAKANSKTFGECCEAFIASQSAEW
jgi:hypothetical protein